MRGRGVVFCTPDDGKEALSYSEPTIIDADGKAVPGRLILDGDALVLAFDAADLAGLRYPITIDPLIGANFSVATTANNEREAAVAYNATNNEYLVVWEVQVGTDFDVWGRRYNATGGAVASAFAIRNQAGVVERNPHVAWSSSTNRYVLTLEYNNGDVIATTISNTGTHIGSWFIDNRRPPTGFSRDPKVVRQTGIADAFLFVWSDSDASVPQNQWVLCERRDSNFNLITFNGGTQWNDDWAIQATTGATAFRRPSVAYDAVDDDFYFGWEHTDGSARSVAVTGDLLFYVGPWPNITLSANGREPAVLWNSARNEYQAVWSDNVLIGGDYDLFLQRVHATGLKAGEKLGGIRIVDADLKDQKAPAFVYSSLADESLVVYTHAFSPTDRDLYAQPIRTDGIDRGTDFSLNTGVYETLQPGLAINTANGRFLAAWEDKRNATFDIFAQQITDTAPRVLETDPPNLANRAPTDYSAKVYFSDAMLASTINTTNCKIIDTVTSLPVTIAVSHNSAERSALLNPSANLLANRLYQISITTGVQDTSSNALAAAFTSLFGTGAGPALVDTDGDGLLDLEEQLLGTNPSSVDTDGDGASDFLEYSFSDPLRQDSDNDGRSDAFEIIAGTNPRDPASGGIPGFDNVAPKVVSFAPAGGMAGQELGTNIHVQFSEPINTATVVYGTSFKVENTSVFPAVLIAGAITYSNGNRVLKFDPSANLPASSNIQITVVGGAGMIADPAGNVIAATKLSSFTTVSTPGSWSLALNEALHHPSYGESTAAGQMQRRFGDGNVPDSTIACPDASPHSFVRGFGASCTGCGGGCGGAVRQADIECTGVPDIFCQDRTVVSLNNGAFIHGRIDWAYPDRSLHSVVFGRTYRSNMVVPGTSTAYLGLFGYRTVSSWETALVGYSGAGSGFTLRAPDGRTFAVAWTGSAWALPAGFYGRFHLDTPNAELKLIFRSGLIYAYRTSDGKLKYVRDRNGQKQTCNYTGSQLTSVTDATGRTTSFGYNGSGRVTTITTYDSRVITYGYDVSQRLQSVTFPPTDEFPSGRQEQYGYTGDALLNTIVNGRGQTVLANRYDPAGLVESQDHIAGTHFYLYDFDNPSGILTTAIDRMGNVVDVLHDTNGAPKTVTQYSRGANELDPTSQWVTSFTHNANGEVTKVVVPRGNVWKFVYDANGNMTERRRKAADVADNDTNDLVEKWKYDAQFGCVLRYLEPRANAPGLPAADKVAFGRFYFYDHEVMETRLNTEQTEMGSPVTIAGTAEQTFGRTGGGQFPAKGAVFNDADADGLPDRGGNLWIAKSPSPKVVDPNAPSQFQAQRQVIEEFLSYNQPGQLLIRRDPAGDIYRWQYFSGAFNISTYPNAGFVLFQAVDSGLTSANLDLATGDPSGASEPNGHLALRTTFAYDARGNTTEVRSPRGIGRVDSIFKTAMTYDANNLLRTRTESGPFSYQSTMFYDGNMMLVEERTPNVLPNDVNGNGIQDGASEQATGTPAYFRATFTYCNCNDVLTRTTDASGLALTTTFEYDLNQKRSLARDPEGNASAFIHDERDLLIRETRGANDTALASTTRFVFDGNANRTKVHDDDLDADAGDTATVTTFDLFDRATKVTDELGNESETVYDRGSFARQQIRRGPDSQGGANEILAQSFSEFDEAGRQFQSDRDHFDAVANVALADGLLAPPINNNGLARGSLNSSVTVFDADGRATKTIDDNLHATTYTYDRADRVTLVSDARGNSTTTRYDADGHAIDHTESEVSDLGGPNTIFLSRTFYDELGRVVADMTPLGNTTRRLYDSRGNVRQTADAQADNSGMASGLDPYAEHLFDFLNPDIAVSGRGNRVRQTFDGANRLTLVERDHTSDGTGNGAVIATLTRTYAYDKSSRRTSVFDGNLNETRTVYDALSRPVAVVNADDTRKYFFYNRASNLRRMRDERQVEFAYTVDKLGRRTETSIDNLPPHQRTLNFEVFQYDGASRMTRGENNQSALVRRYDSLGPLIREEFTIETSGEDRATKTDPFFTSIQKTVQASYDGVGNRTQLLYPSGTVVNETYDVLDRRKLVKDGSTTLAEYMYIGSGGRFLEKRLPQASLTLFRGYDGDRRVTRHDQRRTTDGMRIAGFTYVYDRIGNRWYERTLTNNTNPGETAGTGEAYAYDSGYRLRDYFEGVASSSLDALQNNMPRHGVALTYSTFRRYDFDSANNRTEVLLNGEVESAYRLDGNDAKTNQYTLVNDTFQSHDAAGNLLHEGTWAFQYNAFNQLSRAFGSVSDVMYRHDVLGRRLSKRSLSGANFPGWSYNHSTSSWLGGAFVEEYADTGTFRKEWIYGVSGEPLRQRAPDFADIDNDSNTTETLPLYYLTKANRTVMALVDGAGSAKERYVYDVWGLVRDVLSKTGGSTGASWTLVGNSLNFRGTQFDFEERTALYRIAQSIYRPLTGATLQQGFPPIGTGLREKTPRTEPRDGENVADEDEDPPDDPAEDDPPKIYDEEAPQGCLIRLYTDPVDFLLGFVGYVFDMRHSSLLVKDESDTWRLIEHTKVRGGASGSGAVPGGTFSQGSGAWFGNWTTTHHTFEDYNSAFSGVDVWITIRPGNRREYLPSPQNRECWRVRCLLNYSRRYSQVETDYDFFGPNSNTFISRALEKCEMARSAPQGATGWDYR